MQGERASWLHARPHATLAIFRALPLGGMLCAVPALRALRDALPSTRIVLVGLPSAAEFAIRFRHLVDEFISFPGHSALPEHPVRSELGPSFYAGMRTRRFDIAVQLHGDGALPNLVVRAFGAHATAGFGLTKGHPGEQFHPWPARDAEPLRLLDLVDALGAPTGGSALEFPVTRRDQRELGANGILRALRPGKYICIQPGAYDATDGWPVARFAQLGDRLAQEFGVQVVLTGAPEEAGLVDAVAKGMRMSAIKAALPMSLGALGALVGQSRLLVCNDGSVSQLAAALGRNSVVIFRKSSMQRWAPQDRERHRCLFDPWGDRLPEVCAHARQLLLAQQSAAPA